jgi:purine-binding chemotaxis protein CheW
MTGTGQQTMPHQFATFTVAGHYLGVDVLDVQEVLRGQRLTRVPLAPAVVEGLINLRGQIVPALEMRRMLNLPHVSVNSVQSA